MRLEVGKTYNTRDGNKVITIIKFDQFDNSLPFKDSDDKWYGFDGTFGNDNEEPHRDLVSEVVNTFTVKLPLGTDASMAVIRLLLAQGVTWGLSASPSHASRNAVFLIIKNDVVVDWRGDSLARFIEGTLLDSTTDPVDTTITFADGTSVKLSQESFDKLRNA